MSGRIVYGGLSVSKMDANGSDERTVYVRNLHEKVTKELLEELFIQMGSLVSVLIRDSKGPPQAANDQREGVGAERKRFAFVEFQDVESVLFAVEMLDDLVLFGQRIVVAPRDRTQQAEKYRQQRDRFLLSRVRHDNRQPTASASSKSRHGGDGALPFVDGAAALASVLLQQATVLPPNFKQPSAPKSKQLLSSVALPFLKQGVPPPRLEDMPPPTARKPPPLIVRPSFTLNPSLLKQGVIPPFVGPPPPIPPRSSLIGAPAAALATALLRNAIGGGGSQRPTLAAFGSFVPPLPPPQLLGAIQQQRHSVGGSQPHLSSASSSTRRTLVSGSHGDDRRNVGGDDGSSWRGHSQQRHSEGGSWRSAPYPTGRDRHHVGGGGEHQPQSFNNRDKHSTHDNRKTYFRR